ncbi:MAG: hypothetical protein HQK91_03325 [Nitrospirae bacterium]|nr:hypothetical protein [Nitrospirota bacterium]MBF0540467.1 hypothetical protein [Nitrospirota bacterium]
MSATILEHIKGSELPKIWQERLKVTPNQTFTITIEPDIDNKALESYNKEEDIQFGTFPLGVKSDLTRIEIYDYL